MMSSEDDTECFGLYGDKLLKKAKRTRQRVDAGEPRNSYSSIPNFSSRPTFMSGGLYGSIFNPNTQQQQQQQQQHFSGLFNSANQQQQQCNNFAPAKMLNELLGRQMKAADAATSAENNCLNMIGSAMDTSSVNNSSDPQVGLMVNGTSNNYESATMLRRSENNSENDSQSQHHQQSSPPQQQSTNNLVDNAHMLRDILQGRKKELLALEQELRAVSTGGIGNSENTRDFSVSPTNNNNNEIKTENNSGSDSDCAVVGGIVIGGGGGGSVTGSGPASPNQHPNNITSDLPEVTSDRDEINSEEDIDDDDINSDAGSHTGKQQSSTTTTTPQQQQSQQQQSEIIMDNDNSDSFHSDSSRGSNNSLINIKEEDMIMDDEDDNSQNQNNTSQNSNKGDNKSQQSVPTESLEIKRARVENIVSSMRSSPSLPVQVNGCKKRKLYHPQQHESARYHGAGMMIEEDEEDAPVIKQKRVEKDALKTQLRTMQEQLAEMQQKYVQLCNRMEMESDCQDENTGDMTMELASASAIAAAAAAAAQAEELLEKSGGIISTNPAAAAAAAAAMYLGVGHKMFLEQEAQRLKEAVGGDHPHHPQLPPHHHHPGGQGGPPSGGPIPPPQPHHHPCGPPPHHHHHPSSHQLAVAAAQAAKNAEFSERFPFFRNAQSGPITGTDLEGLAEVLKSEISASLTILIDSILNRFLQQRRFLGKQSDAAAEQLNKDLLLASQLLDRKSPRTKVIDRGPNNNSNNNSNNNNGGGSSNIGGGINNNNSSNPGTSNSGNGQGCGSTGPRVSGTAFPINLANTSTNNNSSNSNSVQNSSSVTPNHMENNSNSNNLPSHLRPPISIASTSMFQHPKTPSTMSNNNNNGNNTSSSVATASMPAVINGAPNGPASSALYSMGSLAGSNPFCHMNEQQQQQQQQQREQHQREQREQHQRELEQQRDSQRDKPRDRELPEQNEALSLVVTTKKKRHKVTDTRITPRTVSRILSQDGGPPRSTTPNSVGASTPGPGGIVGNIMDPKYGSLVPTTSSNTSAVNIAIKAEHHRAAAAMQGNVNECTSPRPYHPPPTPMLPVSLPTSVAIPNPGLHESQVFSPYSPFYGQHQSSSPPDRRDAESPISHPPTLLHPALLAAHGTPDYGHMRSAAGGPNGGGSVDNGDRGMDCHSADSPYDGMQPPLPFSNSRLTSPVRDSGKKSIRDYLSLLKQESMGSLNEPYSSTLTPMHLRKAKLMFFWVRYPSSAVLKMYFPDIKFNKNNTAQLVKWFSNFREFYYIQMEKYARQAITEGMKNADDIQVNGDSEIYRVLNLHYNRNNHIEVWGPQVPSNFRFVVEQTLREFFKAIQGGKDTEQSWKKSIYKVISRLDDPVPEYFKSPNFLEQLE